MRLLLFVVVSLVMPASASFVPSQRVTDFLFSSLRGKGPLRHTEAVVAFRGSLVQKGLRYEFMSEDEPDLQLSDFAFDACRGRLGTGEVTMMKTKETFPDAAWSTDGRNRHTPFGWMSWLREFVLFGPSGSQESVIGVLVNMP